MSIKDRLNKLFRRQEPVERVVEKVVKRFYEASSIGRLTADWQAALNFSADYEIFRDKNLMMARSRELALNNDYIKKYLRLLTSNVIGDSGVIMKPDIRFTNGKPDDLANRVILASWTEWCKRGNCTTDGMMSFSDYQRLALQCAARDGETFSQKYFSFKNKWGFALRMIEPEYFDVYFNATASDGTKIQKGNYIRMSIEYDQLGRPQAYWPHQTYPTDFLYAVSPLGNDRERIPAKQINHFFVRDRASQTRGVPWYASAMVRLKMLKGYEEASLVAARVGAAQCGVITSPSGDEYKGDGKNEDGSITMEAEPGTWQQLPEGYDLKTFEPKHPTIGYSEFHKSLLRGSCSGMGVGYNTLAGDYESVNYSSLRQSSLDDRDQYKMWQQQFIDSFIYDIYESWLKCALLSGALKPLDSSNYEKYRDVKFFPRRWQWVDPQKEVGAVIQAIDYALKSRSQVASEEGNDIDDLLTTISEEQQKMDDLNIKLYPGKVSSTPALSSTTEPEEDGNPPKKKPGKEQDDEQA
jgi:lambda family phage portal protein